MDIDFLMRNYSNENDKVLEMVQKIIDTETENSFIYYKNNGVISISEHKQYHGVRIKMIGIIGKTKTPFNIDFGVGDIVIPKPDIRRIAVQLEGYKEPEVLTYSLESTVAEKWDAIIDRMSLNSRMKDFYDIYYLACHYEFEGRKLQEAIFETLDNRGRIYEKDTLENVRLLSEDDQFMMRWKAFTKNSIQTDLKLDMVIDKIIKFVGAPFTSIVNESEFFGVWDNIAGKWIKII